MLFWRLFQYSLWVLETYCAVLRSCTRFVIQLIYRRFKIGQISHNICVIMSFSPPPPSSVCLAHHSSGYSVADYSCTLSIPMLLNCLCICLIFSNYKPKCQLFLRKKIRHFISFSTLEKRVELLLKSTRGNDARAFA